MTYTLGRLRQIALIASCSLFFCAIPAKAQFIGYTSPQTVQQTLATNLACTGSTQTFVVANLGQSQHFATIVLGSGTTDLLAQIVGLDAATNTYIISDTLLGAGNGFRGVMYGSGYYPIININVTCNGGSFTLQYSGTSGSSATVSGDYLRAQQSKVVSNLGSAASSLTRTVLTPYGDAAGIMTFDFTGAAGPANSTLTINCTVAGLNTNNQTYALVTTQAVQQMFRVPPAKCPTISVTYTSGGASAATIQWAYAFDSPGLSNGLSSPYSHITVTTATTVKATSGVVSTLTIGTPAAGTITLTDLPSASCTGTPATNIVGVFTELAGGTPTTHDLNLFFQNGICVKASVAMDVTVGFQ